MRLDGQIRRDKDKKTIVMVKTMKQPGQLPRFKEIILFFNIYYNL